MGKEITNLEPKGLWDIFYRLTQIPRPSKHESRAADFVEEFGRSLGLETIRDAVGNVVIRKPATAGMETREGVILQGHIDMVPQKTSAKQHDFTRDPIETTIDGNCVRANGTTLGADNGIGVSAALAVLADNTLQHGPLEVLVTVDEETGMTGANGLSEGVLKGKILLNLDSEMEGEMNIGCAGGTDVSAKFHCSKVATAEDDIAFKVTVSGLKGGHSGIDINLGRANAIKLLTRFLKYAAANYEAMLADIDGGDMRNAIPSEAWAIITIDEEDKEDFIEAAEEFEDMFRSEYAVTEPTLSFTATPVEKPVQVMDEMSTDDLINAMQGCPNGPLQMDGAIPTLVQTSSNMAVVKAHDDNTITVNFLVRSSVDSQKDDVVSAIESVFRLAGAEVEATGGYPGWRPNAESPILKLMVETYRKLFGGEPEVRAIHAGLECGIMSGKYPEWDMVSFGPTIRFPHSVHENVDIASVGRFWQLLTTVLQNIPEAK